MDDALATQLASAMTGIAAGDYRTEGTAASATFTVKEKFQLLTVLGRTRRRRGRRHRRRWGFARHGDPGRGRHRDTERAP